MRLSLFCSILLIFTAANLSAQVGINTDDPEQALDVQGRISVADDNTPATEGAIRFNQSTRQFEGYDGTEWSTFDNEPQLSGGAIPTGAIPVYGETAPISANDETENFRVYYGDGSSSFLTVPDNTYLIATWVNIRDNDINPADARILARVGPRTSSTSFLISSRTFYISGAFPDMIWTESSLSPLVIVRPGEFFSASNSRFSEDIVHAQFRGFLVPNLDY